MNIRDPNLQMLQTVARAFGEMRDRVMFLGGATTGVLITDPATTSIRPTKDVDVVVEVASTTAYASVLAPSLRALGFQEDTSEGAPLCRWLIGGIKVDVMPSEGSILGFSNRWYPAAIRAATTHNLDDTLKIRLITAPYFSATKIEAFRDRGGGDYAASHDLEDFLAVVDGRAQLVSEVQSCAADLLSYLAAETRSLLSTRNFVDALPGHLPGNAAGQERLIALLARLRQIADLLS